MSVQFNQATKASLFSMFTVETMPWRSVMFWVATTSIAAPSSCAKRRSASVQAGMIHGFPAARAAAAQVGLVIIIEGVGSPTACKRKIRWTRKQAIDRVERNDLLNVGKAFCRLDHSEAFGALVLFSKASVAGRA